MMLDAPATMEPLPWHLRLLQLLGDSIPGILLTGYCVRDLRRQTALGTIVWVLGVIGATMALRGFYVRVIRTERPQSTTTSHSGFWTLPVSVRRIWLLAGYVGLCVLVLGYAGGIYWLIRPFLPSSAFGH